jgi:hypothetical protein
VDHRWPFATHDGAQQSLISVAKGMISLARQRAPLAPRCAICTLRAHAGWTMPCSHSAINFSEHDDAGILKGELHERASEWRLSPLGLGMGEIRDVVRLGQWEGRLHHSPLTANGRGQYL